MRRRPHVIDPRCGGNDVFGRQQPPVADVRQTMRTGKAAENVSRKSQQVMVLGMVTASAYVALSW